MARSSLVADPSLVEPIREALVRVGFRVPSMLALVDHDALSVAATGDLAPTLRATRGSEPLATAIRLFVLGVAVEEKTVEARLGLESEVWIRAGLLEREDSSLVAPVRLAPVEIAGTEAVIAYDPRHAEDGADAVDMVIGVGPVSEALAKLTVPVEARRSLDLGCGGGVQSIALATHSREVVATDKSDRAVDFARFTMALNHVDKVECRAGDLFEPVADETFDLVVSNPPFVVSPDLTLRFRDSGLPLDAMVRNVAQGAARHLAPGGYAQVMASVPHLRWEHWEERVHGWIDDLGCDGWMIEAETQTPGEYARRWLAHGDQIDPRAFDRWLDYYEREGIEGFSYGLLTLRRVGDRPPWWRTETVPNILVGQPARGLLMAFEAADWVARHGGDEELLHARLEFNPGARLELLYRVESGDWQLEEANLRQLAGLPFSGPVSGEVPALLARCDGRVAIGDLLDQIEWSGERPERAQMAQVIRALILNTFLLPRSD